jgi:Zn-dependent M28 family amino/carboxypeptidase
MAVESYAASVFKTAGIPMTEEPIAASKGAWKNVIGDLSAGDGAPLCIVGAHLDTVEKTPGADDNASGAAALLALAEWAAGRPRPAGRCTIRFAAFNLEEWGMVGSSEHATKLREAGRKVPAMLSLEMIGYTDRLPGSQKYPPGVGVGRPKTGDFISVVGNTSSRDLVRMVGEALQTQRDLRVETLSIPGAAASLIGASLSDHSSFWRCGYPGVMVGDTAFYRNPNYHLPSDTLETLDLPFLEKVTRGLAVFVESYL